MTEVPRIGPRPCVSLAAADVGLEGGPKGRSVEAAEVGRGCGPTGRSVEAAEVGREDGPKGRSDEADRQRVGCDPDALEGKAVVAILVQLPFEH